MSNNDVSGVSRHSLRSRAFAIARASVHDARRIAESFSLPLRRSSAKSGDSIVSVEIVLDGGSFLNWRTDSNILSLEILATGHSKEVHQATPSNGPGPVHGVFDLAALSQGEYLISARTRYGARKISILDRGTLDATRNIGRVGQKVWELARDDAGQVSIKSRDVTKEMPSVVSLESALGAIVVTIGPTRGAEWRIELRQRRGAGRIVGAPLTVDNPEYLKVFFSAEQWSDVPLTDGDTLTSWNAFAVDSSTGKQSVRLRWGGSDLADVRTAQRFRRSFAYGDVGDVTRIRPYWTADQYLAVELTRTENDEGNLA